MKKAVSLYLFTTSCMFSSTIIMNIREEPILIHPYNIILAILAISGFTLYIYSIK